MSGMRAHAISCCVFGERHAARMGNCVFLLLLKLNATADRAELAKLHGIQPNR